MTYKASNKDSSAGKRGTFSEEEVAKFSVIADEWWDRDGKFKMLHTINPLRLRFITQSIYKHLGIDKFDDIKILDIGCGGGLVSIPLAKMGALVEGVDASKENVNVASAYAKKQKIDNVKFENGLIEDLAINKQFDVILALEVIEHVNDKQLFLTELQKRLKPGGIIILSTINRTLKSMLTAKVAAEYILGWLPIGTHSWNEFVKPDEIKSALSKDLECKEVVGMKYNMVQKKWYLDQKDTAVNYFLVIRKS